MVTKEQSGNNYLRLDNFFPTSEAPKISNPEVPKKQEGGKFTTVAQELDKTLNEYVRFTSSSEGFKNALKEFGGNINQFNQNLILFALTLAHMEKAAEKDEELKKSLPSLQEKMKAVNENIGKIAKELGYTVSQYSLDKLMGKDLNGVKETLAKDFGVEPKLEALFSPEALNSLTDLFAFIVNKIYPGSVNATFATVPIISDTEDKEGNKQKGPEGKITQQVVLQQQQAQQQQAEQSVFKQQSEEKQNKDYHSPLRGAGKKFAIAGVALGVFGGFLVAGSFIYLPIAGFGLAGIGLAAFGPPLVVIGGVTWVAGVIDEAIHNRHVPKAQEEALKEEKKRKRALEEEEKKKEEEQKKQKKIKESEEKYKLWKAKNADKDEKAIIKQLTNQAWLEKHINAETEAEHKKRVEEAKKEIEKIMEEAKKRNYTTALHDLLIEKAKDPNTPSWFLALLAQLKLSYHYTDLDMFKELAGNPNTPQELLADFATRKRYFWAREYIGSDIREIAAKNQNTPPETLAKLLLSEKYPVNYAAAANPSTPQYALNTAMYSKKVDITIKRAIAENPSTPPAALDYALSDKELAYYVLDNPSITKYPYLLVIASNNPDRFVSRKANEILSQIKSNENKQE